MKKAMWSAVGMLALSLFLYAAPVIAEDEGDGDFVSAVAPKGKGTLIPPGHFGIVARYADELLSVPACPKTNWNVIAMGLFDGVDDPTLADEITDFFVVDTRTTAEYCAGHLPVAVNIPVTELAKPYSLAVLPMDKLFFCSATAATMPALLWECFAFLDTMPGRFVPACSPCGRSRCSRLHRQLSSRIFTVSISTRTKPTSASRCRSAPRSPAASRERVKAVRYVSWRSFYLS